MGATPALDKLLSLGVVCVASLSLRSHKCVPLFKLKFLRESHTVGEILRTIEEALPLYIAGVFLRHAWIPWTDLTSQNKACVMIVTREVWDKGVGNI